MAVDDILKDAEHKMKGAVSVIQEELASIRTGRANPRLLDRLNVEYYGSAVPLNQLASISVPEPRLLVLQPFDKSAIGSIEKAIMASDLGLTPSNDGTLIRLSFPQLTEDRRKELIRMSKDRGEDGRVAVRNVRRHAKETMERMQREHEISEDDLKRAEKELQRLTDLHVAEVDRLMEHKEKELLEV